MTCAAPGGFQSLQKKNELKKGTVGEGKDKREEEGV